MMMNHVMKVHIVTTEQIVLVMQVFVEMVHLNVTHTLSMVVVLPVVHIVVVMEM